MRVDLETFSETDLTKSGVYRYTEDPSFDIMLFGYRFNGEDAQCHDLLEFPTLPERVMKALYDPRCLSLAWNFSFEHQCLTTWLQRRGLPPLDIRQGRCTMIRSAMTGLPMKLSEAGKAAKIAQGDSKVAYGRQLVKYFCLPCKPTKANGNRTRNLPHHDPERWALFKEYCRMDVVAESAIDDVIMSFPLDEREFSRWHADQDMNARGIYVDRQLVKQAITMNATVQARNLARIVELTGVTNAQSVAQLKDWLEGVDGERIESLNKKMLPELIADTDDAVVKEVLKLRQETSKSSIKKYQAIDRAVCADGRVRGLFQFYGANRTGREAGRLVQFQNLKSNTLPDLELARTMARAGDLEGLEFLFGSVPDVLSQLIRTAFIAAPGCKLVAVDESAIEARVLAWLADEEWRLEVFRTHGMIYEASASAMFNVPMEEFLAYKAEGKKHPLRKKGKVSELACLGPDTLVLTRDRGWVTITLVTKDDKVWDGIDWVSTAGPVFRGMRDDLVSLDGLVATSDHLVWDGLSWREARTVASRESILDQCRGSALGSLPFCGPAAALSSYSAAVGPHRMVSTCQTCEAVRAPAATAVLSVRPAAPGAVASGMSTSAPTPSTAAGFLTASRPASLVATSPVTRGTRITAAAAYTCGRAGAIATRIFSRTWSRFRAGMWSSMSLTGSTSIGATSPVICGSSPAEPIKETDARSSLSRPKLPVYDLRLCGSRNRFTVKTESGVLIVHNCGYQGGTNALVTMGALEEGLKAEELPALVTAWRAASPRISSFDDGLWKRVNDAAFTCVSRGIRTEVFIGPRKGKTKVVFQLITSRGRRALYIWLPSGRPIIYWSPSIRVGGKFKRECVSYEGYTESGLWGTIDTYGGKLVENITQAIARDVLFRIIDQVSGEIVAHVHDEVVCEVPAETAERYKGAVEYAMGEPIPWAPGLPLAGEGECMAYYRKGD
jgi:DNA polymerase